MIQKFYLSYRTKMFILTGAVLVSSTSFLALHSMKNENAEKKLRVIQNRYLPKIELSSEIKQVFEKLRRKFQDAVAASDFETLQETYEIKQEFKTLLLQAKKVFPGNNINKLEEKFEQYFTSTYNLSSRLIAKETGEKIIQSTKDMQELQVNFLVLLENLTSINRTELPEAFSSIRTIQQRSSRIGLIIGLSSLLFIFLLSSWLAQSIFKIFKELSAGFERFGQGNFSQPVPILSQDELGDIAKSANEMAKNLQTLANEKEKANWISSGQATLFRSLRGNLELEEVAKETLNFLANYLQSPLSAFYVKEKNYLKLLTGHALDQEEFKQNVKKEFLSTDGIIGQVSQQRELLILEDLPNYFWNVHSGLGKSLPNMAAFLPLYRYDLLIGVIELAFFSPLEDRKKEFLTSISESLAVATDSAKSRRTAKELLERTQDQAEKLRGQELELRSANDELKRQREELQQTNEELEAQRATLESEKEKLELITDELEMSRKEVELKAEESQKASQYKSDFLANVSHELRTPLNSIMVLSQLLSENHEKNLTQSQIKNVQTIFLAGEDLLHLISDILDLSKIEAGKLDIFPEHVSLQNIAQNIERLFEPQIAQKNLQFTVQIMPDCPNNLYVDPQRLDQILRNIIANAIKFTDRGSISVVFHKVGPHKLGITIKDTGIGIPRDKQRLIFESFKQVDSSTSRKYGGTGLGLAISLNLARKLGGDIAVKSNEGEGSEFTITIPESYSTETPHAPSLDQKITTPSRPNLSSPREVPLLWIQTGDTAAQNYSSHYLDPLLEENALLYKRIHGLSEARKFLSSHRCAGMILDMGNENSLAMQELSSFIQHLPDSSLPKIICLEEKLLPLLDGHLDCPNTAIVLHGPSFHDRLADEMKLFAHKLDQKSTTISASQKISKHFEMPLFSNKRILLVDDDIRNIYSLRQVLLPTGSQIEKAYNGKEAIEILQQSKEDFDLILMDIMMPEMDGLETVRILRQQPRFKNIPIIALTAKSMKKDREDCLEAGANDYLSKPVDNNQLLSLLKVWLTHAR